MSLFNREVLSINGNLFLIKKILREEYGKDVELLKQWYLADIVFRKDNLLYFCEQIVDLEFETI
jgi:hypothetical protein